jgi:hypothetical protein
MDSMNSYFSHDSNARNDEKILSVRIKHGMEGYGIYFAILERMRDATDYLHVKDYNIIAFDLRVSNSLIKSIVEDFGLFEFTGDGKRFYSESFLERMQKKDGVSEKRSNAAKKRWDNMQMQHEDDANAMQMQEKIDASKGKKRKIPPIIPPDGESFSSEEIPDDSDHVPPAVDAGRSNGTSGDDSGQSAFSFYISEFNRIKGSRYAGIEKARRQFNARIREGFTAEDMLTALQNAMKEEFHVKNRLRYLTPEFFTRPDKIEQHGRAGCPEGQVQSPPVETGAGVWIEGGKKFYGDRGDPIEIPMDTPRRPGKSWFYNREKGKWDFC